MRRAALLGFVLASWACNGSDETRNAGAVWCDGLCSAVSRCHGDAAACNSGCQRSRPRLNDISMEGAGPLAACLEVMKCSDLFGGEELWGAAYQACWAQAKSVVEVTPSVRTFCEAYTLAEFECRYWYATDACERDFGMWSENVRGRVAACAMNPVCDEAEACVRAIFESR